MDQDTVIKVENLHKKFTRSLKRSLAYGSIDLLRDFLGIPVNRGKLRKGEFWALDNISFEVKKGEKIGFIGENGSGKTTLLRVMHGIFPPDAGSVMVRGRIGALIAVGAGFSPQMTGRENIYLNGTILGMTRKEIDEKIDEIIAFSDIGEFIDAPISTYSSGMRVRLGFSIAVNVKTDILLVDEVLSVGDLAFNLKSKKKLSDFRNQGGTFIVVSHSMQMLRNMCDRIIWLEHGRVIMDGEAGDVIDAYEDKVLSNSAGDHSGGNRVMNYEESARLDKVEFLNEEGKNSTDFTAGSPLTLRLHYSAEKNITAPIFTFTLLDDSDNIVFDTYSHQLLPEKDLIGKGYVDMKIEDLNVKPGHYFVTITFSDGELNNRIEWHERAYKLNILHSNRVFNQGKTFLYPNWEIVREK